MLLDMLLDILFVSVASVVLAERPDITPAVVMVHLLQKIKGAKQRCVSVSLDAPISIGEKCIVKYRGPRAGQ